MVLLACMLLFLIYHFLNFCVIIIKIIVTPFILLPLWKLTYILLFLSSELHNFCPQFIVWKTEVYRNNKWVSAALAHFRHHFGLTEAYFRIYYPARTFQITLNGQKPRQAVCKTNWYLLFYSQSCIHHNFTKNWGFTWGTDCKHKTSTHVVDE